MGACFSKDNAGAKTSAESKGFRLRLRLFDQSKKRNVEEFSSEKVPLKDSERGLEDVIDLPIIKTSETFSPDLAPDQVNLTQVEHSIAPSDSGIESIGTAQDELQASVRSKKERDELLKQLEHEKSNICQKCGHFKLENFRLLTTNTVISHNLQSKENSPGSAETECHQDVRVITNSSKNATINFSNEKKDNVLKDRGNSEPRSPLKESNSSKENVQTSKIHYSKLTSEGKSKTKMAGVIIEETSKMKAPLVRFDSLDTNLNDDVVTKQDILLTDFQDITELLCKCDYYSKHEINHGNYTNSSEGKTQAASVTECGVGEQLLDEDERSRHLIITQRESHPNINQSSVNHYINNHEKTILHSLSLCSREKSSSLSKIVSFAHHKETTSQTVTKSASPSRATLIPVSREMQVSHCESSVSESSSGVYTHQTVSRSLFSNGHKDANQCSVSLGSVEVMISDSSSDLMVNGTEDDMTSLDLDNISRLTFHSTTSTRPLNGSAEELTSSLQIAQPTTVDGMDCVIIPKETYHQMQTELSVLKQQLISLSSLIQESEGQEQNTDFEADTQA